MFRRPKQLNMHAVPLKPFVFRIKDGYLIGLAIPPEKGSPCQNCVELWLKQRNVWVEKASVPDLSVRRDLLADLLTENSIHTLYEIHNTGTSTRMDSLIFPHPLCTCNKSHYISHNTWTKDTNFAFSPITQIRCIRNGTPNGNLWLTTASGESPLSKALIASVGIDREREPSRFRAVEEWLKKSAYSDLPLRIVKGETFRSENFQTGESSLLDPNDDNLFAEGIGIGPSKEDAILDGLFHTAKIRTLRKYISRMKNPMLVVGTNSWIRNRVPFFLLQNYDLHLLFYPNSTPAWVVGAAALSRVRTDEPPHFVFASGDQVSSAFEKALFKILEICQPPEPQTNGELIKKKFNLHPREATKSHHLSKLNMWWTHWIYRCPKISMKDTIHLESYPKTLEMWRSYFRDGQEPLSILQINHSLIPREIRTLIKIDSPVLSTSIQNNINGIATWSYFQDALA